MMCADAKPLDFFPLDKPMLQLHLVPVPVML